MAKDRQSALSNLATTPTSACRIPIFAPTRRPVSITKWRVNTPWGWAVITGRLGQQHRDLLDAARMIAEAEEWTSDGRLHLKVDPARLRAAAGGDSVNNARILDWLRDLRSAEVEVHVTATGTTTVGGILADVTKSADTTLLHGPRGAFDGDRHYLRLDFGLGWSKLIDSDRAMRYPLKKVVALQYGFSQAVARYCLSHTTVRDTVAGLMEKVGSGGLCRHRRADLQADSAGLAALGIIINGDAIKSGERRQSPVGRRQSPVGVGKVR